MPCDCSREERDAYEADHPSTPAGATDDVGLQRWSVFGDKEEDSADDSAGDSSGSVLDWAAEQAGAAAGAVGDAAGGAYDWAAEQAGAAAGAVGDAAGAVGDAAGGAYDWAAEQAGAAAGAVSDAAAGAYDWAAEQGAAALGALLSARRADALGQIAAARQQLPGGSLEISGEHLASLNSHLASLRSRSGGTVDVPSVAAETSPEGTTTMGADGLAALLSGLESAARGVGVGPEPSVQPSLQRLLGPAAAAAAAAAEAAATGAPVAGALAPETAGISLLVLAVIVVIVAVVVAIVVYATTRTPAPTTDEPVMPEGLSREKKEKWERCNALYKEYKKGIGGKVADLGTEIGRLQDDFDNNRLPPDQQRLLCAKVHEQLGLVQQLMNARRRYIDSGCDEFNWYNTEGSTEEQRRADHEREVDNVRSQDGNLRALLHKLEAKGVC